MGRFTDSFACTVWYCTWISLLHQFYSRMDDGRAHSIHNMIIYTFTLLLLMLTLTFTLTLLIIHLPLWPYPFGSYPLYLYPYPYELTALPLYPLPSPFLLNGVNAIVVTVCSQTSLFSFVIANVTSLLFATLTDQLCLWYQQPGWRAAIWQLNLAFGINIFIILCENRTL